MTPAPLISVINMSDRVSDADVERMVYIAGTQLARDVAPVHGLVPALEFVPKGGRPNPDGAPCWILDVPDMPGVGGYHGEDDQGNPFIKVFANPPLDTGGTVLHGSNSVSSILTHEIDELVGDGPGNKWVDGPDGSDYAYELCDATESDVYEIEGVSVSNFLYPAFFDPQATAGSRLDHNGVVSAPFATRPDGYQIKRTEPGVVSNVFGEQHQHVISTPRFHYFLAFGPKYAEHKKAGKILKARRRVRFFHAHARASSPPKQVDITIEAHESEP